MRFDGKYGRRFWMYMLSRENRNLAYISNYGFWKKSHEQGVILERLVGGISHETLHIALKKHSSRTACKRLDRICRPVGGLITGNGLPAHCCLDVIERYYKGRMLKNLV